MRTEEQERALTLLHQITRHTMPDSQVALWRDELRGVIIDLASLPDSAGEAGPAVADVDMLRVADRIDPRTHGDRKPDGLVLGVAADMIRDAARREYAVASQQIAEPEPTDERIRKVYKDACEHADECQQGFSYGRMQALRAVFDLGRATTHPAPHPVGSRVQIDLSEEEAKAVADLVMAGDDPCEVSLCIGNGCDGYGLYAWQSEYPEEGASFIKPLAAAPAPAVKGYPTCATHAFAGVLGALRDVVYDKSFECLKERTQAVVRAAIESIESKAGAAQTTGGAAS